MFDVRYYHEHETVNIVVCQKVQQHSVRKRIRQALGKMRDKNIFAELPVEEISDTDEHISLLQGSKTKEKRSPHKNRVEKNKRNNEPAHIKEFGALSISDMGNECRVDKSIAERREVASVVRKKITGADNWKAFLENNRINNDAQLTIQSDSEDPKRKSNTCVAIDCEMVGIGEDGKENMLARVSIVNSLGECLYDTFVKPTAAVTDYRTPISGVRPCDLVKAEKFPVVQKKVLELIRGKLLVGHAVYNDLIVLKIRHPRYDIRDTTRFKKFYSIGAGTPSLKKLTAHFLNVDIQCGEHSSIQDAQAAMQLYMLFRREWEADLKKRRHLAYHHHHTKKKPKTSYKPKRFGKNYKK